MPNNLSKEDLALWLAIIENVRSKFPAIYSTMPNNLSKEDLALWLAIIENVKPLEREPSPIITTPHAKKKMGIEQKSQYPVPAHPSKDIPLQSLTRQQYRNYTVDARLDLHGYTQEEAYAALIKFVHTNYERQTRTLLIITGKGSAGGGILKQQLPRWLGSAPLKNKILSIAPARPEDGGQGALYVLLRRMR